MPAFALLLLGGAKGLFTRVLSFLGKLNIWQLGCIALALFAGVQTLRLAAETRHSHKVEAQLAKSDAARHADRLAYAKAQEAAQAKNRADIQRTEQRQKEISDARVADLNSRLERIARELRDNPSAKGSAGRTPIPETGPAPCRAIDPAWLCLSPADRLLAAQNEERHDQLIDWVIQQSKVDPNK
jgi:small-conductance mechanosensitive channel